MRTYLFFCGEVSYPMDLPDDAAAVAQRTQDGRCDRIEDAAGRLVWAADPDKHLAGPPRGPTAKAARFRGVTRRRTRGQAALDLRPRRTVYEGQA